MNESDFNQLTPDLVLSIVEDTLGKACGNVCRPLNSYINRVYEVLMDDGEAVVIKFYRPNRWSEVALFDEHNFLLELAEYELPVIAPLKDEEGATLFLEEDTFYALFPKKGGRICDEPTDEQWGGLGRLLARMHLVGARHEPKDRITMGPEASAQDQLTYILDSDTIPVGARSAYQDAAEKTLALITPMFEGADSLRIHGDLHHQNLIFRPDEGFFLIDFDDMAMGPPVQDLWMLLPGRVQDSVVELDMLLEGYQEFRDFDRSSLRLVEPLRAMRYLHYTAWCVRQALDGGFNRLVQDWGSDSYWRQETNELVKQQTEIRDAAESQHFMY